MVSACPMPRGARCTLCTGPVTVTSRAETPGICSPGKRSSKRFSKSGMTRGGKKWNKMEEMDLVAVSSQFAQIEVIQIFLPAIETPVLLFQQVPLLESTTFAPVSTQTSQGEQSYRQEAGIPMPAFAQKRLRTPTDCKKLPPFPR